MKNGESRRGASRYAFVIAMVPALAVSTSGVLGVAMGAGILAAMLLTAILLAMFGKLIRPEARGFACLMFSATSASVVFMAMEVLAAKPASSMGFYLPLAALSCLLTGCAAKTDEPGGAWLSIRRALGQGLFSLAFLTVTGSLREILGSGAIFGQTLDASFQPMRMLAMTPGGFILAGILLALVHLAANKRAKGGSGA